MRVEFVIVDTCGAQETLACPICGSIFDIDAHSNKNLIFDREYKGVVAKCPDCGAVQSGDDDEIY